MTDDEENPGTLAKAHGASEDVLADTSDTTVEAASEQGLPAHCGGKGGPVTDNHAPNIDAVTFLDTIFADADPNTEVVCVTKANEVDGKIVFWNLPDDDKAFRRWNKKAARLPQAWYFAVSTMTGERNDKGTALRRRVVDVMRYHVLVLDDIGTKATPPPVEPTYMMTTSLGEGGNTNEQWGFALVPGEDHQRYEALVKFCHEKGWGDPGADGCYRLMRVPGSANLKPGRNNFRSVVTHWEPNHFWTLDDLAAALGCTDLDQRARAQKGKARTASASLPSLAPSTIDPLYTWLNDNGHVVDDDGTSDFIDIECPWHTEHTDGNTTAGFSPLGRGEGDWVQSRGFKCLHAHCQGRGFKDFMKVMGEKGAPRVSGHDPLPWLQHRFTYIGFGARVADLEQRKQGGRWIWDLEDWGKMYKGRVMVPGRDSPIEMKTAFLEHKNTRKVVDTQYWPVKADEDVAVVVKGNQEFINTYVPPNWPHTSDNPEVFLDHMDFLLPSDVEHELFLDWLAHKVQNPAERSYAVVMIAEDGYGVGRSWQRAMMDRVLQGKVRTATLPQLIGKGTSAENNFNDWSTECQLLVVEEAKDTATAEEFYKGYQTFKQRVDTRVTPIRANPKYGRTRDDFMWFNALIFSNHSDALVVPTNDRRICVLTNPSVMSDADYYDRLEAALNDDEATRVYWYLMERDLEKYDHVYPPMTPGKLAMIEQNIMPSAAIKDHIESACEGDIFTKKMLKSRVLAAADALDYDGIVRSPGGVNRNLWKKMGPLRDEKNGARYQINGVTIEVRAIRNVGKWKVKDAARARDEFAAELLKNDKAGGMGLSVVKR